MLTTPFDFTLGTAQTTIESVKNTSLVVGRDDDNLIKFSTDNQIIFEVAGGDNVIFKASGEIEAASLDISGSVDIDGTLETDGFSIEGTAVTATGAELNYSDTGAAVGTVVASKIVTVDANKDVASFRNITLTGELDAGSLDVSGDADIDGTLEADAITVNGATLNSVIADEATALAIALG